MVLTPGYCRASSKLTRANWRPERSAVGKVKWRPALGSTAQNTWAVPERRYWLSPLASLPGWRPPDRAQVGRQSHWLLIQAHHRLLGVVGPFIGRQDVLHLGDVVLVEFGHAPHFFPPRLEVVMQHQSPNGFAAHLPYQPALDCFLGHQPHGP